jgi:toxin ParE1/3/4
MRVRLSGTARRDLLDIYAYLSSRNPAAADRVLRAINDSLRRLTDFPYTGRERDEFGPAIRSLVVRSYLVFHRIEGNDIVVIRVVDGRMDLSKVPM